MAMNRFKSILVPVDISEPETARPAVERAVDLAHASEGNIRLVYVRSILPVTYMEFIPPHFDEKQQTECEHKLAALAAGVPLPASRVSSVVRLGSVYNEVLKEADQRGRRPHRGWLAPAHDVDLSPGLQCGDDSPARQVLGPGGEMRSSNVGRAAMKAGGLALAITPLKLPLSGERAGKPRPLHKIAPLSSTASQRPPKRLMAVQEHRSCPAGDAGLIAGSRRRLRI